MKWGIVAALLGLAAAAPAQTFAVVSVKVNTSGRTGWDMAAPLHGTLHVENASLLTLAAAATETQRERIVGGADWVRTTRFDVEAKGDPNATPAEVRHMLQALLASRFQWQTRAETRQLPIFELLPAKNGPRLPAPSGPPAETNVLTGRGQAVILGENTDADGLAEALALHLLRPVVNHTGIAQRFSLGERGLAWSTGVPPSAAENERAAAEAMDRGDGDAPAAAAPPSLGMVLGERLGLQIRSTTGPVSVLVIVHAVLPQTN